MSRKEQSFWVVVTVLAMAALVVALAAVAEFFVSGPLHAVGNIGTSINNALVQVAKTDESGGTAANDATVAAGLQVGSMTAPTLNARLPRYQWVDGATNVPDSSAKRYVVGVVASGAHIVTAVKATLDSCMYGLSVTSGDDPLIIQDHLPGPGTYYEVVWQSPQCVADQPPASGWQAWTSGGLGGV